MLVLTGGVGECYADQAGGVGIAGQVAGVARGQVAPGDSGKCVQQGDRLLHGGWQVGHAGTHQVGGGATALPFSTVLLRCCVITWGFSVSMVTRH